MTAITTQREDDNGIGSIVHFFTNDGFVFMLSLFFVFYPLARVVQAFSDSMIILAPPLYLMPIVGAFGIRLAIVSRRQ